MAFWENTKVVLTVEANKWRNKRYKGGRPLGSCGSGFKEKRALSLPFPPLPFFLFLGINPRALHQANTATNPLCSELLTGTVSLSAKVDRELQRFLAWAGIELRGFPSSASPIAEITGLRQQALYKVICCTFAFPTKMIMALDLCVKMNSTQRKSTWLSDEPLTRWTGRKEWQWVQVGVV